MDIFNIISMLGGVGLFLFGMSLMGDSLERIAGAGLERLLEKLTNNRLKGFALGIGVTAIIQSSAATTVMALGFVNAGIMKLVQAIPVVFGANIGSTVTAQILRFSGSSSDSILLKLCKPSSLAPIMVCIAAFMLLISKKKKVHDFAGIIMGFGILFIGMNTMETALAPLSESASFQQLFVRFSNPLLGFLVGMVVTMMLQSSSASVGILQALAFSTGSLTFSACLPIIVGQNVGKCITVVLGSIGTSKKAKRLAASHVCFNVFGAIIIMSVMYALNGIFKFGFFDHIMTKGNIADMHLAFNVITSLILLPFVKQIADFTGVLIRGDKVSKIDTEIALLDDIFISTPTIALEQCKKVMTAMADTVTENYKIATTLLTKEWDDKQYTVLQENEDFLDKSETALSEYLIKITAQDLAEKDSKLANEFLFNISNFERMGDYCVKIANVVTFNQEQNITFSESGKEELNYIINAVQQTLNEAITAFRNEDSALASRIEPLCHTVGTLKEVLIAHHIKRLQTGSCGTAAGISLMELVTAFDRIASHCSNVTFHMLQKLNNEDGFDMHAEKYNLRHSENAEDIALMQYYENMYILPVEELVTKDSNKPKHTHEKEQDEKDLKQKVKKKKKKS